MSDAKHTGWKIIKLIEANGRFEYELSNGVNTIVGAKEFGKDIDIKSIRVGLCDFIQRSGSTPQYPKNKLR